MLIQVPALSLSFDGPERHFGAVLLEFGKWPRSGATQFGLIATQAASSDLQAIQ
jgi:hypothetical protein